MPNNVKSLKQLSYEAVYHYANPVKIQELIPHVPISVELELVLKQLAEQRKNFEGLETQFQHLRELHEGVISRQPSRSTPLTNMTATDLCCPLQIKELCMNKDFCVEPYEMSWKYRSPVMLGVLAPNIAIPIGISLAISPLLPTTVVGVGSTFGIAAVGAANFVVNMVCLEYHCTKANKENSW